MSACVVRVRAVLAVFATILAVVFVAPMAITGAVSSPETIPPGPTVIGVDGTTVNRSIPIVSDIVGLFLDSVLNFNQGEYMNLPGYNVVINDYPRSFGLLTLGGPNYDDSVAQGVAGAISYIRLAQNGDSSVPVKLVCLSQGGDVCSQTNDQLRAEGYDQSNVTYIMLGSVSNADGGLKVRIPRFGNGIFIPGPGVTLGVATPTTGSDATIIQVSYEYDGFARAPEYPINVLAVVNAAVGALLYHGNYRDADPYAPDNIVSTTPDGRITNIVIPAREVPLLTVAKYLGLPQSVVDVINPMLKAIIDTAYSPIPEGQGAYPTEAVSFKLLPSPEKFVRDVRNVHAGFQESVGELVEAFGIPTIKPSVSEMAHQKKAEKPSRITDDSQPEPEVLSKSEAKISRSSGLKPSVKATGDKFRPGHIGKIGSEETRNSEEPEDPENDRRLVSHPTSARNQAEPEVNSEKQNGEHGERGDSAKSATGSENESSDS